MENGNDNDTKDITTVNEQQGSLDASDGPERPASVRDTDSSSVKTLIGLLRKISKVNLKNNNLTREKIQDFSDQLKVGYREKIIT